MKDDMKAELNPDILNKIEQSSVSKNIKDFLLEVLEFEYDHIDEAQPRFKDAYTKSIEKYKL